LRKSEAMNRICPLLTFALKRIVYCQTTNCMLWSTIREYPNGDKEEDCLLRKVLEGVIARYLTIL